MTQCPLSRVLAISRESCSEFSIERLMGVRTSRRVSHFCSHTLYVKIFIRLYYPVFHQIQRSSMEMKPPAAGLKLPAAPAFHWWSLTSKRNSLGIPSASLQYNWTTCSGEAFWSAFYPCSCSPPYARGTGSSSPPPILCPSAVRTPRPYPNKQHAVQSSRFPEEYLLQRKPLRSLRSFFRSPYFWIERRK